MSSTSVNTNTSASGATNVPVATETINSTEIIQRVKQVIGDSGVDGGDVSLTNPMPIKHASTGFLFSTVNSTVAQLGSGATFNGAVEAVIDQPAYSILLTSDQPGTLTVYQYIDAAGTQLAGSITYAISPGVGFARSGTMNGNYLKVAFQNTGGSTTTTLRLDTAFGNILPATQLNNMPMALSEVQAGVTLPVSAVALPLPTGAATAANQVSGGPQTGAGNVTATTQRVTLAADGPEVTNSTAIKNSTASMDGKLPALSGGKIPVTDPTTLPLPAGAATQSTLSQLATNALETIAPFILSPLTVFNYSATGTTAAIQVIPGAWYAFSVSKTYTAATVTFTASGGASGQSVITTASTTNIAVGQQIVGTGIPIGALVTAVSANVSVTINVPLTATASGTYTCTSDQAAFTFQSSVDGSTNWTSAPAIYKGVQSQQSPAATQNFAGLYLIQAPASTVGTMFLRVNIGTLTNCTLQIFCDPWTLGAKVRLGQCLPNAFTQANWVAGACALPVTDLSYLGNLVWDVATFSGTGQTFTFQQTNDPTLAIKQPALATPSGVVNSTPVATATNTGEYALMFRGIYGFIQETGTALTGWSVSVPSATVGPETQLSALSTVMTGTAAQGSTASGNPIFTGAVAKTAQPTARTDGQIVAPLFGKVGHAVQRLGHTRDLTTDGAQVVLTNTTETTIQAAVASTFNDLSAVNITSNATFTGTPTGVRVDFRDTTAGSIRFSVNIPTGGGAFNLDISRLGNEIKQATVNTNWTAQVAFVGGTSPAIGTGDIRITPKVVGNI